MSVSLHFLSQTAYIYHG